MLVDQPATVHLPSLPKLSRFQCRSYLLSLFFFFFLLCTSISATSSSSFSRRLIITRRPMATEIKAIIYDLDGTLIDTETLSTEGIQAVVEPFGKTFTWATKKKILGLRGEEWGKIVIDDLGLEGQLSPAELVRRWEEYLDKHSPNIEKMPGAQHITEYFARLGVPQAIATSSSMDLVQHKRLKHGDMFGHMAVVVCGNDPEVQRGKPNPDIYLVAARRLGVPPENCLVFEDAFTGVRAGKSAGMRVVAIPDKQLDPTMFQGVADQVLASLEDFSPSSWGFPDKSLNGGGSGSDP